MPEGLTWHSAHATSRKTAGDTSSLFARGDVAQTIYDKLIREKIAKGYGRAIFIL